MISVEEALGKIFDLVTPMATEQVPLRHAAGRVMAQPIAAKLTQPPFPSSAMDGYAVLGSDVAPGAQLTVIGESAAGHRFDGSISSGQTVRIFTGAPVPEGADRIVIQEDVSRDGDKITIGDDLDASTYVRPAGNDFSEGDEIKAPRLITSSDVALFAAMNNAQLTMFKKPTVAIIATGDELVMPGEDPGPDQIIASNGLGLAAMIDAAGANARLLPIAQDNPTSLARILDLASSADMIVTIGGASVGDHDIVADVAAGMGLDRSFYKVAMRPGKPLMAGRLGDAVMIGLPGNPVSALVCGQIFVIPALRKMLGLGSTPAPRFSAKLAADLPANGPREHYARSRVEDGVLSCFEKQDSALLSVLSQSNALLVRPPHDGALKAGSLVQYLPV